jgi:predicted DNA-binding ribbon-helix-helix protein
MIRSNLDLYPESWMTLEQIAEQNKIPRNRLIRSLIEVGLTDPIIVSRSVDLSKTTHYRRLNNGQ